MALPVTCTCRTTPHCPSCNAAVRVPYSNLERGAALTALLRRLETRDRSIPRENLNRIAEGKAVCPGCGETVQAMHDRACVSGNLSALGVSTFERDKILGRISFPE